MSTIGHCIECKKEFLKEELVNIRGGLVCSLCKPIALQRAEEYENINENFKTAGFGIRFGAVIIDGIILWIVGFILGLLISNTTSIVNIIITNILSMSIALTYNTYFNGKDGATIGKKVCKIKIIRMDGSPIGYSLAAGRYFATILSGLILCIGYLMAAFDKEYALTLHDKICKTRVVYS